jgi:hypothetical protein
MFPLVSRREVGVKAILESYGCGCHFGSDFRLSALQKDVNVEVSVLNGIMKGAVRAFRTTVMFPINNLVR